MKKKDAIVARQSRNIDKYSTYDDGSIKILTDIYSNRDGHLGRISVVEYLIECQEYTKQPVLSAFHHVDLNPRESNKFWFKRC